MLRTRLVADFDQRGVDTVVPRLDRLGLVVADHGTRVEPAGVDGARLEPVVARSRLVGLGRRASGVEKAFDELLRKKLNRIAKLAIPEMPRGAGKARGLFVFFADFGRVFASREAVLGAVVWRLGSGPFLDGISFVSGLKNGRYLIRQSRRADQQVPKFESDMTPPELAAMIGERLAYWGKVMKAAGIEPQ